MEINIERSHLLKNTGKSKKMLTRQFLKQFTREKISQFSSLKLEFQADYA